MGSTSDWDTMSHAAEVLEKFNVPFEKEVVSAHRTPVWMAEFAQGAEARGIQVIIAGAGGAAHLPGMCAAKTALPVLGVPVGVLAIGKAGATNAGLLAVSILSNSRPELRSKLRAFREEQTQKVRHEQLP